MIYREADGSDKVAAFERGIGDSQAALAFETSGVSAFVIEDTYLTAYNIHGDMLIEVIRQRLYDGPGSNADVQAFLESEASKFQAHNIASFGG